MKLKRFLSLLLALGLQAAPLLRAVLPSSPQALAPSAWAIVLKLAGGAVALLGSYHAVSGATQIVAPYTVNATVGTPYIRQLGTSGQTAHFWTANTGPANLTAYPLVPGLWLTNATGLVVGTPTQPGVSNVIITAWEFAGSTGPSVSNIFLITITNSTTPPVINPPLSNELVSIGGTAIFAANAVGGAPLSYAWFFNGTNLPNTNSSLIISNVQSTDAGSYEVIATNPFGSATNTATLTIDIRPPVFTTPLTNFSVVRGSNVTLRALVTGAVPLSYAWQFGGAVLPTATNANLTLPNIQSTNAGTYLVTVTNPYGAATNSTTLTVNFPPALTTRLISQSAIVGSNVTFIVGASGTAPLSYHWRFNGQFVTNATNNSLLLSNVQVTNAGNYQAIVTNLYGAVSSAATLAVGIPPSFTVQPQDVIVPPGSNATLIAFASGTAPLTFQWLKQGTPVALGNSLVLSLTNLQTTDSAPYALVVTNAFGSVTSQVANLIVTTNLPPALLPLPDVAAEVLLTLRITNVVAGAALPSPDLKFGLGQAPAGAHLNSRNGVFSWRPARAQAASTNPVTIIVADTNQPPLTSRQTFQVAVGDYVEIIPGQAVARAGDTGKVSIALGSSTSVSNVSVVLDFSGDLRNWSAQPASNSGVTVELQTGSNNQLSLSIAANNFLPTDGSPVALLRFDVGASQGSAFLPLTTAAGTALRPDGSAVGRILLSAGRVVAVGSNPLLEALLDTNQNASVTLYGPTGQTFTVERNADLSSPQAWTQQWQPTLSGLSQTFAAGPCTNGSCFYRAR